MTKTLYDASTVEEAKKVIADFVNGDRKQGVLHVFAYYKNPDMIEYILSLGADPNKRDSFGKTPLYYAVKLDDKESAQVLVNKGAKLEVNFLKTMLKWQYFSFPSGCFYNISFEERDDDGHCVLYHLLSQSQNWSCTIRELVRRGAYLTEQECVHPEWLKYTKTKTETQIRKCVNGGRFSHDFRNIDNNRYMECHKCNMIIRNGISYIDENDNHYPV